MAEQKWRFPDNRYTSENGLDTSDMEMFKKDPVASLAREICQNSIDAAYGEKPVKIEFSLFQIPREEIPGIDGLTAQIDACYSYKKNSPKEGPALKELKKNISKEIITCLRISDFNTTGVEGAKTNQRGTPFYNLTKGSGVSDKGGCSGGSKGIGKFASFVVSTTNTVFYSTRAKDKSCAHIGISKLRSTPISGDPDLLTMGIGYYGEGDRNFPILKELLLEHGFSRDEEEVGTDVYIIGFNDFKGWQNDIIAKVLESFMVAVIFGDLEVTVDGKVVARDTVRDILDDEQFQCERTKTELRAIRAQFELLQENDIHVLKETLLVDENNSVTIFLKQYGQIDESKATKHCVMVRYPYMKITSINPGAFLPFSALCIIHDNELNKRLRDIENPQHTDWEIKRLNNYPDEKKTTRKMKKALINAITDFIRKALQSSSGETTDIEGAGEFLPSQDELGGVPGSASAKEPVTKPITVVKPRTPSTEPVADAGESDEFAPGTLTGEGESGIKLPKKRKSNPGPNPEPTNGSDGTAGSEFPPVPIKVPLSGMRYRTVVTDKSNGKYDCIFTSLYDENNCEFAIRLCGEAADKYPVDIISASIGGVACSIKDGKIVGLKIEQGKNYKISYTVNHTEMFASEVILNAYR